MSKPFNPKDHFFKKAKEKGFRARSVFKLEELQQRFHILKRGQKVVDLGCAPGSFLQFAAKIIGPEGKIIGFDIKPVADFHNPVIKTFVASVLEADIASIITEELGTTDSIISDIAPNTSGIKELDHGRSIELNRAIVEISKKTLKPHGDMLLKVFDGSEFPAFVKEVKVLFQEVKIVKPEASRSRSREVYVLCLGYRSSGRGSPSGRK